MLFIKPPVRKIGAGSQNQDSSEGTLMVRWVLWRGVLKCRDESRAHPKCRDESGMHNPREHEQDWRREHQTSRTTNNDLTKEMREWWEYIGCLMSCSWCRWWSLARWSALMRRHAHTHTHTHTLQRARDEQEAWDKWTVTKIVSPRQKTSHWFYFIVIIVYENIWNMSHFVLQ